MPTRAEAATSRLFSQVQIGSIELEQRTWIPAMVPWRATEDGFVTDDVIDGHYSAVIVQAANRMHMQKALLAWLLNAID